MFPAGNKKQTLGKPYNQSYLPSHLNNYCAHRLNTKFTEYYSAVEERKKTNEEKIRRYWHSKETES
jgi:hypothetical protein